MRIDERCTMETRSVAAVKSGRWSDDLREHAASCEQCAEAIFVAHHLGSLADELDDRPLPDARVVWIRAQMERRQTALQRATLLITVMQVAAGMVGAAVSLLVLGWLWPALRTSAGNLLSGVSAAPMAGADRPEVVVLASFVVLIILGVAEMWPKVGATR